MIPCNHKPVLSDLIPVPAELVLKPSNQLSESWGDRKLRFPLFHVPLKTQDHALDVIESVVVGYAHDFGERNRSAMRRRGLRIETQARRAHSLKQKLGRWYLKQDSILETQEKPERR